MPRNKEKQLTFDVPCEHTVTLIKYELEQDDFGNHNIYYIEDLNGKDHFEAFEGLHKKINDAGLIDGETFVIKKLQIEGYANGNPFFKIEGSSPMPKKAVQPMHKSDEKFEKQFEPKIEEKEAYADDFGKATVKKIALDLHELTLRAEELEKCVTKLIKEVKLLLGDAGHKPGDENL